jgi:hypothetical protein
MTRANILVITRQGKFKFQSNSSAYPSWIMGVLINFATSTASRNALFDGQIGFYDNPDSIALSEFIHSCGLTLGTIGTPSYYYEVDFVKQTVRVWESKTRWVNAPIDWKERGWNCYQNSKGKYGWDNHVKGKLIYSKKLVELVKDVVDGEVHLYKDVIEEAKNVVINLVIQNKLLSLQ